MRLGFRNKEILSLLAGKHSVVIGVKSLKRLYVKHEISVCFSVAHLTLSKILQVNSKKDFSLTFLSKLFPADIRQVPTFLYMKIRQMVHEAET